MNRKGGRGHRRTTRGGEARAVVALVLGLGARAEAQMAKQGTYTGRCGWSAMGKTFAIEKDHMVFVGECSGMVFNDAGRGFMHGTSWVCPGMNDLLHGLSTAAQGSCVATDKDGDNAFVTWKGHKATEPNKGGGECQWAGGTGKYTGLTGNKTYDAVFVVPPTSGYSRLKGAWRVP